MNILPLDETLEEPTPSTQARQNRKRKKGPTNSLETAIDGNNNEIIFHLFRKLILKGT